MGLAPVADYFGLDGSRRTAMPSRTQRNTSLKGRQPMAGASGSVVGSRVVMPVPFNSTRGECARAFPQTAPSLRPTTDHTHHEEGPFSPQPILVIWERDGSAAVVHATTLVQRRLAWLSAETQEFGSSVCRRKTWSNATQRDATGTQQDATGTGHTATQHETDEAPIRWRVHC